MNVAVILDLVIEPYKVIVAANDCMYSMYVIEVPMPGLET
jgi:hypothetical protein